MFLFINTHTYIQTYIIYVHTYIHTYTHNTYIHTHTHTHTYIHTYIDVVIHQYILARARFAHRVKHVRGGPRGFWSPRISSVH